MKRFKAMKDKIIMRLAKKMIKRRKKQKIIDGLCAYTYISEEQFKSYGVKYFFRL